MAPLRRRRLEDLRARIAGIEQAGRPRRPVLPFGVPAIDRHLPQGGLPGGALHEIWGDGSDAQGAAAALFAAGVLARMEGPVLWCLRARDLFAPALAGVGLHPVLYAETGDEKMVPLCLEEGLRCADLAGVVGEVSRLAMTASRRLQLAAETSGVAAFLIRRDPRGGAALAEPSAAVTRWRIDAAPSASLPVPGAGRARWRVELLRCRAGEGAAWEVETCDAQGHLALAAELADRSAAPAQERHRASA